MIHQPMGGAQGQAEDIKVEAAQIVRIKENLVKLYSMMTGQTTDQIIKDLDRDNFMSAQDGVHRRRHRRQGDRRGLRGGHRAGLLKSIDGASRPLPRLALSASMASGTAHLDAVGASRTSLLAPLLPPRLWSAGQKSDSLAAAALNT